MALAIDTQERPQDTVRCMRGRSRVRCSARWMVARRGRSVRDLPISPPNRIGRFGRPDTHHVRWIESDPIEAGHLYVSIEMGARHYQRRRKNMDGSCTWLTARCTHSCHPSRCTRTTLCSHRRRIHHCWTGVCRKPRRVCHVDVPQRWNRTPVRMGTSCRPWRSGYATPVSLVQSCPSTPCRREGATRTVTSPSLGWATSRDLSPERTGSLAAMHRGTSSSRGNSHPRTSS